MREGNCTGERRKLRAVPDTAAAGGEEGKRRDVAEEGKEREQ
jgi:hypothetical protein